MTLIPKPLDEITITPKKQRILIGCGYNIVFITRDHKIGCDTHQDNYMKMVW